MFVFGYCNEFIFSQRQTLFKLFLNTIELFFAFSRDKSTLDDCGIEHHIESQVHFDYIEVLIYNKKII